jgi:hypothetical protein
MTRQLRDSLRLRESDYSIEGISGNRLLEPKSLGLEPVSFLSTCWRGFYAEYAIQDLRLVLVNLYVNLLTANREEVVGPIIEGVKPERPGSSGKAFNNQYHRINKTIDFSGGVLVAREYRPQEFDHVGFDAVWNYEKVCELIFDDGVLVAEFDRSDQVFEIRRKFLDMLTAGADASSVWKNFNQEIDLLLGRPYSRRQ